MYVPQLMLLNEGPVTMTTMKLNVQFDAVLNAFAGARMRSPTISAGCRRRMHGRQRLPPVQARDTHVEPGHAQPADGKERVEDEKQDG